MPVKDLAGPPPLTVEQKTLRRKILTRLGLPLPKRWGRPEDDGLAPVEPPKGPGPSPLAGAAEADEERP
jgi:hypothetical protein